MNLRKYERIILLPGFKWTDHATQAPQTILDTGYSPILNKSFSELGLREILKASGVPKGSFYHYFSSKEAFGCVLLRNCVDNYDQTLDGLLSAEAVDGRERLILY